MAEEVKKQDLKNYIESLLKKPNGFIYQKQNNRTKNMIEKNKKIKLKKLYAKYNNCTQCPLATQGRNNIVWGKGDENAKLMFIGEGPGREEDAQGIPFVGRAGKLLTKIIESINLEKKQVYITNVVKCRPPNNRNPLPIESETCKKLILLKEIEIIKPKIICTLGAIASKALFGENIRISQIRGKFTLFNGIPVMPTYHPAYLLRNPSAKRIVWEDMKNIKQKLFNKK